MITVETVCVVDARENAAAGKTGADEMMAAPPPSSQQVGMGHGTQGTR